MSLERDGGVSVTFFVWIAPQYKQVERSSKRSNVLQVAVMVNGNQNQTIDVTPPPNS